MPYKIFNKPHPKSEIFTRLSNWKKLYKANKVEYSPLNLWEGIGQHPLDNLFISLAQIYLGASFEERRCIEALFKDQDKLFELIICIRRLSLQVKSMRDCDLVRLGFILEVVEGGRYDFRDTIVSLILLRYSSEKAGINISLIIDGIINNFAQNLTRLTQDILENVRKHSDADVVYTIKEMGPPDWKTALSGEIRNDNKIS
jgi:signal transduction histidine kinase